MSIPNVDTLIMSFDFHSYKYKSSELLHELQIYKEHAKQNQIDGTYEKVIVNLITDTFEILSNGKKSYAYILHNELLELNIAQARSKNENTFPVCVKFKSEFLWFAGLEGAYNRLCVLLNNLFGDISAEKISRVDLCYHTDEIKFTASDIDKFTGKFRSDEIYRSDRELSGFTFGSSKSGLYARLYNKSLEVKQKNKKLWFYDIWQNADMDINNVWNIEFEVDRKKLREFTVNNFNDLTSKIGSLWNYLVTEWLVLRIPLHSRKENDEVNPLWVNLRDSFWFFDNSSQISRKKQAEYNANSLIPNIMGYLSSFAANIDETDFNDLLYTCLDKGFDYLFKKHKTFEEIVQKKKRLKGGESNG